MSFIVGGVRKAKSRQANVFHPINIIDLVAYQSDERLSRIKEAQLALCYERINRDVIRSSIAMFMVDISRNAIREKESNPQLYGFLKEELKALDGSSGGLGLYPHRFALRLCHYLGFTPNDNYGGDDLYFDLMEGAFTDNDVRHKHILNAEESYLFHSFLDAKDMVQIEKEQRNLLLDRILEYYSLHLEGFGPLKCLPVLRSVLS